MKKSNITQMIELFNNKEVVAEWDRREELKKRFNGLSNSTLAAYQKEMETVPEFKKGIMKPSPGITWFHIKTFIWYLCWKDANLYRNKKIAPSEVKIPSFE